MIYPVVFQKYCQGQISLIAYERLSRDKLAQDSFIRASLSTLAFGRAKRAGVYSNNCIKRAVSNYPS